MRSEYESILGASGPVNSAAGTPALDNSPAFFSQLLESSVDGICAMGRDGRCTFVNAAASSILGYLPGELVGHAVHDMLQHHRLDGSFYPATESRISRAARESAGIRVNDEVFWHRNGTPLPVTYSLSPITENGEPSGAVITFFDFTGSNDAEVERNRLHKEVEAANNRFAEIFKQAPAFMCVLRGPEHVFELINDRYLQLVGNRPDLVGKTVKDGLPEIAGQGFLELLDRVYRTGEPFIGIDMPIFLQRLPDSPPEQRVIDLSYIALRNADGMISGILAHGVDQTIRSNAEQALRSSEERYRTLVSSMDEGFCIIEMIVDDDGRPIDYRFLEINPAFEKHSGLRNGVGRTIREMVPEFEQRWLDLYAEILATGEPARVVDHSLPMERWFDVYACRIGDAGSRQLGIIFNDITERRGVEENLRKVAANLSEADRRKDEFLAMLAHELRNPLAPIVSAAQMLAVVADNGQRVRHVGKIIARQANHMTSLINDLLDVSRVTTGLVKLDSDRLDIRQVVDESIEQVMPFVESKRHKLTLSSSARSALVMGDRKRLVQVITNLVQNAAKYTPEGGDITVTLQADGSRIDIVVKDNGMGIDAELLPFVFDLFTQERRSSDRAHGGLGLGLSLVKSLVGLHGGTVEAKSGGAGCGSTFTVSLPLLAPLPQDVWSDTLGMTVAPKPLRLLVVDDNADAADLLAMVLETSGHEVVVQYSSMEALEKAATEKYDVFLLDIGLPDMDGNELARRLRSSAQSAHSTLIAVTGYGQEYDRDTSIAAGFDYYFVKPANPNLLVELLAGINPV